MDLDNQTVSDIAEKSIGRQPESVERASTGLVHETFILCYPQDDLVLQVADADQKRVWALERNCEIFSWENQLPIPDLVQDIEEVQIGVEKRKFYISERLPGKILQKSLEEGISEEIGCKLAQFHDLKSFETSGGLARTENGFEVKQFDEGSFSDWLLENIKKDTEVLKDSGIEDIADDIKKFFEKHGDKLPKDFNPVLCHNDYSPDNILAQEGKITGIIDFDFTIAGDTRRDLVKTANSFWMEGFDTRNEIYEGYRKERNLEDFQEVEPIYRLETLLRIIASLFKLKEEVGEGEKDDYREKLSETLEYCRRSYRN